jgi:hypothetical protein
MAIDKVLRSAGRYGSLATTMYSPGTRKSKRYVWVMRCVAAIAAFCFSLVVVVAALHHHGDEVSVTSSIQRSSVAAGHVVFAKEAKLRSHTASAQSYTEGDCALCDWLATSMHHGSAALWTLTVALSALSVLVVATRLSALCSRPAPRRGLRAPPFALAA